MEDETPVSVLAHWMDGFEETEHSGLETDFEYLRKDFAPAGVNLTVFPAPCPLPRLPRGSRPHIPLRFPLGRRLAAASC